MKVKFLKSYRQFFTFKNKTFLIIFIILIALVLGFLTGEIKAGQKWWHSCNWNSVIAGATVCAVIVTFEIHQDKVSFDRKTSLRKERTEFLEKLITKLGDLIKLLSPCYEFLIYNKIPSIEKLKGGVDVKDLMLNLNTPLTDLQNFSAREEAIKNLRMSIFEVINRIKILNHEAELELTLFLVNLSESLNFSASLRGNFETLKQLKQDEILDFIEQNIKIPFEKYLLFCFNSKNDLKTSPTDLMEEVFNKKLHSLITKLILEVKRQSKV